MELDIKITEHLERLAAVNEITTDKKRPLEGGKKVDKLDLDTILKKEGLNLDLMEQLSIDHAHRM